MDMPTSCSPYPEIGVGRGAPAPLFRMLEDILDGIAYGFDPFGVFIGNLQLELFLERHDQLDQIKRIGIEVFLEARARHYLGFLDPQLFRDDRPQSVLYGLRV